MPKHQQQQKEKKAKKRQRFPTSMRKRGSKTEVIFDPEARKAHLRGFSERKRQRRAFGLAMQKVKDRKAKIQQRAEHKKDELQQIEEAERQKQEVLEEAINLNPMALIPTENDDGSDCNQSGSNNESNEEGKALTRKRRKELEPLDRKVYDDNQTETTWGGQVTVTTSVVNLGDDGEDSDDCNVMSDHGDLAKRKNVDIQQKYAGNVHRYLEELKGSMPGKHSGSASSKPRRKGKNGAADMRGVGGNANFKIASKLLNNSISKVPQNGSRHKKGKKRRL